MKKILLSLIMLCCMTAAWAEGTGDGTKENPYTGEWQASELGPKLKSGKDIHLAFDCVIKNGSISVTDTKLNKSVANSWKEWAPGNLINNPDDNSPYKNYGTDNPSDRRKKQSFIIAEVSTGETSRGKYEIIMQGCFDGFYRGVPEADGFYNVYWAKQMNTVLQADGHAKVRLTEDVYMSDLGNGTFCDTFYGILDGDGHTIKGDGQSDVRAGKYLFTKVDGATIKNLTVKGIRVNSQSDPNQGIIASKAMHNSVFENITFDNVHTFSDHDNAGVVAGWVEDCTFTGITVKNSDATTDGDQSGCIVGHAINCTFKHITVENCESTADDEKAGGVAGRADTCSFDDIKVLGCLIKTNGNMVGGIVGKTMYSSYTGCVTDDQSCVCADGNGSTADAGGVAGHSESDSYLNCINSALVAGDNSYVGGIVGYGYVDTWGKQSIIIESCLNTGMVIGINMSEVIDGLYSRYKNKQMRCTTRYYEGKEYAVRIVDKSIGSNISDGFGGIIGYARVKVSIKKCTNFGSLNKTGSSGGIAGKISVEREDTQINNCLSSFESEAEDIYGIFADLTTEWLIDKIDGERASVYECLNATNYYICPKSKIDETGSRPIYTIKTWESNEETNEIAVTEDQIASGYLVNKLGWPQNIGTDRTPLPLLITWGIVTSKNPVITHTRELSKGISTICLPFAVKTDEHVQYYKPQSGGYTADSSVYHIRLVRVEQLAAGEPGFYLAKNPGETYTFHNAGGAYQFEPQEYPISVEPSASGDDMSWTMSGSLLGAIKCHDLTNYGNNDRQIQYCEMIGRNDAYIKGPSYIDTFTDGNLYNGKPIYIVSSTSPYDVNFDDEVNVTDVISFIHQGPDFTPYNSGDNEANRSELTDVILGKTE